MYVTYNNICINVATNYIISKYYKCEINCPRIKYFYMWCSRGNLVEISWKSRGNLVEISKKFGSTGVGQLDLKFGNS